MTISLLHFPLLAQLAILKNLSYRELFLLSICSTRSKNLISLLKLNPLEVRFHLGEDSVGVTIGIKEHNQDYRTVILMEKVNTIDEKESFKFRIGGKEIECRQIKKTCPLTQGIFYNLNYSEPIQENSVLIALYNHIAILLNSRSARCQLQIESSADIPRSAVISDLKDTIPTLTDPIPKDARLLKIRGLCVHESGEHAATIMEYFTGSFLLLYNAKIESSVMVRLVRKWKAREIWQNLKGIHVIFQCRRVDVSWMGIKNEIGVLPHDPKRRPEVFMFDPRIVDFDVFKYGRVDCYYNCYDVRQDNDGKLASMKTTPQSVWFAVWDENSVRNP